MKKSILLLIIVCVVYPAKASAKDFYVDPNSGVPSGDGSAASPWKTIQEVIDADLIETQGWQSLPYEPSKALVAKNSGAPIKAGDTIYLRSGYHGELSITGHYNTGQITIAAEPGHTPQLKSVLIRACSNWRLSGLHVSAEHAPTYEKKTLVTLESHGHQGPIHDIVLERCVLQSVADSSSWTAADWNDRACNGVGAGGDKITLRHNTLKNVNFGLSVTASNSLVEHNLVENFAGDGMRGLGNNTTFSYNTIKNCYDVNENHDDGFQSWSTGEDGVGTGEVVGIVLRGNVIINYEDPQQPHRGSLQGIGCFDGMFVDWVVENNVVITDHWHGITLSGARNSRIINNTVLDPNDTEPGPAWIRISDHKNGTSSQGCVVRNNLVQKLNVGQGVTVDHNLEYSAPGDLFVDPGGYDLHLKATASAAIDQGDADLAPALDRDGVPRPQGSGVDIGAYEWTDAPPPPDGGHDASADDAAGPGDGRVPATDVIKPSSDGLPAADAAKPAEDGRAPLDDGCNCQTAGIPPGLPLWLPLLLLLWRRRRA